MCLLIKCILDFLCVFSKDAVQDRWCERRVLWLRLHHSDKGACEIEISDIC